MIPYHKEKDDYECNMWLIYGFVLPHFQILSGFWQRKIFWKIYILVWYMNLFYTLNKLIGTKLKVSTWLGHVSITSVASNFVDSALVLISDDQVHFHWNHKVKVLCNDAYMPVCPTLCLSLSVTAKLKIFFPPKFLTLWYGID